MRPYVSWVHKAKVHWSNRQNGDRHVKVHLGRVVVNVDFIAKFSAASVQNIITTSYDHYVILVSLSGMERPPRSVAMEQLFHEAAWACAPDCNNMVESAWTDVFDGSRTLKSTWDSLSRLVGRMREWSHTSFGSIQNGLNKLEKMLQHLRRVDPSGDITQEEKFIDCRLYELFEREEIMACQRSRID